MLLFLVDLDFAFIKHLPESFAAAFVEPNCEFCSFAALVFPSGHLPGLFRFADFFLALRTFSHSAHSPDCYSVN